MKRETGYMHASKHISIPLWMRGIYKYSSKGFQIDNLVICLYKGIPLFTYPKNEYNRSCYLPYKTLQELLDFL